MWTLKFEWWLQIKNRCNTESINKHCDLIFAKNENMNNIIDINNVETKHFAVRD